MHLIGELFNTSRIGGNFRSLNLILKSLPYLTWKKITLSQLECTWHTVLYQQNKKKLFKKLVVYQVDANQSFSRRFIDRRKNNGELVWLKSIR